jgi:hypothetical protein
MNLAPGTLTAAQPDPVRTALIRLAEISESAGHPRWPIPEIAIDRQRLARLQVEIGLTEGEVLALALVYAAESNAAAARQIAIVQAPLASGRPLAGLLATLFASEGLTVLGLLAGPASRAGLFSWGEETTPLPERSLGLPAWLAAALAGIDSLPPAVAVLAQPRVALHSAAEVIAAELAAALAEGVDAAPLLVVRCGCPAEGEAIVRLAAGHCSLTPCEVGQAQLPGLAAWLVVANHLAVTHRRAAPGECIDLGEWDRITSPLVLITGSEGQIVSARPRQEWRVSVPDEAERRQLWQDWGLRPEDAEQAAVRLRQSAGRIAELGRAMIGTVPDLPALGAAMQAGGGRIDGLARRSQVAVKRDDIVLPEALGNALDRLRDRILLRNRLGDGLGPTIAARYRPGVRALFTGESGTGKTLAAHWLAGEAGLPCYRVDLAAMTSKWIGETEKNLSQLLDAAENGDVLLFFDEADALFGARTDVGDANDRHANAQTNYLLQRIEEFDGVALMATNSRDRFDPAFVRRLDAVLDFPLPDASARRMLWDCHLGQGHCVPSDRLDHLAAAIDLAGGHVRNVVLAAQARALSEDRAIGESDLLAASAEEYAKLGRSAPPAVQG